MVVTDRIRKAVGMAARLMQRTASQAQAELKALGREGVISRKDVADVLRIARRETLAGTRRVARFVKSEVKYDSSLASKLACAVMERTRKASGVLRPKKQKSGKKGRKR